MLNNIIVAHNRAVDSNLRLSIIGLTKCHLLMHELEQLLIALTAKHGALLPTIVREARENLLGGASQVYDNTRAHKPLHIISPCGKSATRSNNQIDTLISKALDSSSLRDAEVLLTLVVEDIGNRGTLALLNKLIGVDKANTQAASKALTQRALTRACVSHQKDNHNNLY